MPSCGYKAPERPTTAEAALGREQAASRHHGRMQWEIGRSRWPRRAWESYGGLPPVIDVVLNMSAPRLGPVERELHQPFCTGRSWSPRHLTKRRGPPSQTACEVSCRAGPWKWSRSMLPCPVSPFLRACGGHTGGWFPRAGHQEGRPASAASPFEDNITIGRMGFDSSASFVMGAHYVAEGWGPLVAPPQCLSHKAFGFAQRSFAAYTLLSAP